MKGKINGIWLTQENGTLHPRVIPNLSFCGVQAAPCDFEVILLTNTNQLQQHDLLAAQNILIQDHSVCSSSIFYKYFLFFLKKGIEGDKAAFALASDILRMSILELTPEDEYFIYMDPNDLLFDNLKERLARLDTALKDNSLGFSYYVEPLFGRRDLFHTRNDLLIALKRINPGFFSNYLKAYQEHLENKYQLYYKPVTDKQAQDLAQKITSQTNDNFFKILINGKAPVISATFGDYKELSSRVNCNDILPHMREVEHGNTWLPVGKCLEEQEFVNEFIYSETTQTFPKRNFRSQFSAAPTFFERRVECKTIKLAMKELSFARLFSSVTTKIETQISEMLYAKFILDYSLKRLPAPPERKMITLPSWEEAIKNPRMEQSLPIMFFQQIEKEFLIHHRYNDANVQNEYDKRFGLAKK